MRHRARFSVVAAVALSMAGAATGSSYAASNSQRAVEHAASKGTISILEAGSNDFTDGNLLRFVALLKRDGYTVNVNLIEDQATALRAVVAGRADFLFGGMTEAVLADANSPAHLEVVGVSDQASDYLILSQKRFSLKNLSGATMGIASPGDATQVLVEAALRNEGVDVSSLHYVTVGGTSARVTALLAGQIDLAPVLAPSAVPAIATGKVKLLLNTGPAVGPYLIQTMITTRAYVDGHERLVQNVVDDLIDAERWAQTDESGYISIVNKAGLQGGLSIAEEKAAWKADADSGFNAVNGGLCLKYVTDTLKYSYKSGALTRADTPARSEWLDDTFVQHYLAAHNQPVGAC